METKNIYAHLCQYDQRNPYHINSGTKEPREKGCLCWHCKTGEDELACMVLELQDELKRAKKLASLVTVRQVIDVGDEYIEAAGLNPWCLNEGLTTGDERINIW